MARKLNEIKADLVKWANNQIAKKEKELKNEILESKILESLFMELKDYIKNPGKSIYYHVREEINEINSNNKSIYEYCVLCDSGSANILFDEGETIVKNALNLKSKKTTGKFYDPDEYSLLLYLLIAHKFSRKLKNEKSKNGKKWEDICDIEDFKVSCRNENKYCVVAETNNTEIESIQLGGDWVVSTDLKDRRKVDSWSFFERELLKENQNDLAKMTHTIMGHPVWPCTKIEGKTINQARGSNISIYETLHRLEECWKKDFKLENAKGLEGAFCRSKEWFELFGGFENYIEFWDLERFYHNDISSKNITVDDIRKVFETS